MLLNHLAAILWFSGPLLYIGLWLVLDPAGVAAIPGSVFNKTAPDIPREVRNIIRLLGATLLAIAIAL